VFVGHRGPELVRGQWPEDGVDDELFHVGGASRARWRNDWSAISRVRSMSAAV
jgi:hypothetical protein